MIPMAAMTSMAGVALRRTMSAVTVIARPAVLIVVGMVAGMEAVEVLVHVVSHCATSSDGLS
jgi:hypothetical protein